MKDFILIITATLLMAGCTDKETPTTEIAVKITDNKTAKTTTDKMLANEAIALDETTSTSDGLDSIDFGADPGCEMKASKPEPCDN
ncbi:MAG: hypothetical protein KAH22_05490 [Thiotrichaceae bacterium]|nr:hypothetical protein [Thiotrichaceae bacterium]